MINLNDVPSQRILRNSAVRERIGVSNTTLYELIKKKEFNAPIRLSPRCVGWLESDVNEYLQRRIKASRPDNSGRGEQ